MKVARIFSYPVGGCMPIEHTTASFTPIRLEWDRTFAVVGTEMREEGVNVTQRQAGGEKLLRVRQEIDADLLRLTHPALPGALVTRLTPPPAPDEYLKIWYDIHRVREFAGGSLWFSAVLGREVRLVVRMDAFEQPREIPQSSQMLYTSEESLAAVNAEMAGYQSVMGNYRPNVVTVGGTAFQENRIARFTARGTEFLSVKPCERCPVINVDAVTTQRHGQPMKVLRKLRPYGEKDMLFGHYFRPSQAGIISVGDEIEIIETQPDPVTGE